MTLVTGAATAKKTGATVATTLATFGLTPESAPLALSILIGLSSGTAMAWFTGLRRQEASQLAWYMWIGETLALWVSFALLILLAHEVSEFFGYVIGARLSGGVAVIMAFTRTDILNAIARRTTKEIAERKAPD
ncbi:hypothetical protein [uncultured Sulfitobacter sp.]|uniref:hypothetical protein n=1 Tax=uncultured Sulfitobacter sp. TaxID=191468 RepID=UPI0025992BBD|nr:hypothetical protein [uncultured Sulfitobacter sp.]